MVTNQILDQGPHGAISGFLLFNNTALKPATRAAAVTLIFSLGPATFFVRMHSQIYCYASHMLSFLCACLHDLEQVELPFLLLFGLFHYYLFILHTSLIDYGSLGSFSSRSVFRDR
jgi:hypothetical protein